MKRKKSHGKRLNNNKIDITYNIPQLSLKLAKQRIKVMEWGRGTGKSTALADEMDDLAHDMPRGLFVIVGDTFMQILTKTLPGTIHALEMKGYYESVHFFVGKQAPKKLGWPRPYKMPFKWDYAIHWYTGAVFMLISQDRPGNGRGLNIDAVIGDEIALLDENELSTNVILSLRGSNKKAFSEKRRFRSIIFATSTPISATGRWIFKYEEQAMLNPSTYYFSRADARYNLENLPADYFSSAKVTMPDFLYDAEMRNIRMRAVQDGFYPLINADKHYYTDFNYKFYEELGYSPDVNKINCIGDSDRNGSKPLILSVDWGSGINCLVVCQNTGRYFRYLKNFYVMSPKIIDDLAKEFTHYYSPHAQKEVMFYYDRTGDDKQANSRITMAEQFAKVLRNAGWTVHVMSHGEREADHESKHLLWNLILSEREPNAPKIRINRNNCKELIISMENAEAYENSKGAIKKNKKPERNKSLNQAHTTHFSDAADIPIWRLFKNLLNTNRFNVAEYLPSFYS